MDRTKLTERIRMLGIPILLSAGALVLVAYGVPDRNPPQQQFPKTAVIKVRNGEDCFVRPVHIGGNHNDQLTFVNQTGDVVKLFFPTNVFGTTHTTDIGTPPHHRLQISIDGSATQGSIHEYAAYSVKSGELCAGKSHPGIIVR